MAADKSKGLAKLAQQQKAKGGGSIIQRREEMRRAVNLLKLADRRVNSMERLGAMGVPPIISIRSAQKARRAALDRVAEAKQRLRTAVAARST